jgi:sialate O-acetylesterase
VQLASYLEPTDNPAGDYCWVPVREAQTKSLKIPHTGMAVAIDIGEVKNIHPVNKYDVGLRLARWALARDYGRTNLVCSGPLYKDMQVKHGKIRITFNHVGGGLMVGRKDGRAPAVEDQGGKLARFAVAGKDKVWHWAEARIDGDTVLVGSDQVPEPVAVRYAWSMTPAGANLYNKDGLPASPFRTDDWE